MRHSRGKYYFQIRSLLLLTAVLLSVTSAKIGLTPPADSDLVYCPLTKKYQPRQSPVRFDNDPLGEICASPGTLTRFSTDLVLSGKAHLSGAERVKLFFQYSENGRLAIAKFVSSLHGSKDNETPFHLSFGKVASAGSSQYSRSFVFDVSVDPHLYLPLSLAVKEAEPDHRYDTFYRSNLKYGNIRPRSPPVIS